MIIRSSKKCLNIFNYSVNPVKLASDHLNNIYGFILTINDLII